MNMILSIITIILHDPGLQKTLDSISSQTMDSKQFEHIIVEGDTSLSKNPIVLDYINKSKHKVTYICEEDTGRFNAMNKGLKNASGKYLLFLNAKDTLSNPDVLSKVFKSKQTADILYGDAQYFGESKPRSLSGYSINKDFFILQTLFHQSTFIKNDLFKNFGLYNENYQIVGDFEFWLRAIIKHHASIKYLPHTISLYDTHGISSTSLNKLYSERALAITKYYSGYQYYYHLLKYIYYQLRILFHVGR